MKARAVVLTPPQTQWQCPNCECRSMSREARPHSQMHACPGLGGILAPLIPEGMRCKVEAVEREDVVGSEQGLRFDEHGRAIMAVCTVREDGCDTIAFAPSASMTRDEAEDSGLARLLRERMHRIREATRGR